jgi:hypothetical protein
LGFDTVRAGFSLVKKGDRYLLKTPNVNELWI